jgi:uncharacterized protein YxjI
MTLPATPAGWTRFVVKSKFGAGRDFAVLDPRTEEQLYFVDGKLAPRPRADVQTSSGEVVYQIRGKLLAIHKRIMITDGGGAEIATLKAKMFSPIKNRMTLEVKSGQPWELEGSFMEKNYSIVAAGRPVAQITQKWLTIRDAYVLDVADGTDPGLALAVLWAVDRWVERD